MGLGPMADVLGDIIGEPEGFKTRRRVMSEAFFDISSVLVCKSGKAHRAGFAGCWSGHHI